MHTSTDTQGADAGSRSQRKTACTAVEFTEYPADKTTDRHALEKRLGHINLLISAFTSLETKITIGCLKNGKTTV